MVLEILRPDKDAEKKLPAKDPAEAVAAQWKKSSLEARFRKAQAETWGPAQAARNWVTQFMLVCYGLQRAGRIRSEGLQAVGRLCQRWIMSLDAIEWHCDNQEDPHFYTAQEYPVMPKNCPKHETIILHSLNPEQNMADALETGLKALKAEYELISIKEVDIAPDIAMVPQEWQNRYFPGYPNQKGFDK